MLGTMSVPRFSKRFLGASILGLIQGFDINLLQVARKCESSGDASRLITVIGSKETHV